MSSFSALFHPSSGGPALHVLGFLPTIQDVVRIRKRLQALREAGTPEELLVLVMFDVEGPYRLPDHLLKKHLPRIDFVSSAVNQPNERLSKFLLDRCLSLESHHKREAASSGAALDWVVAKRVWKKLAQHREQDTTQVVELETERLSVERGFSLSKRESLNFTQAVRKQLAGLGPLENLLLNSGLHEIMINGPSEIYVEEAEGVKKLPLEFFDEHHLKVVVDRLVSAAGRRVDFEQPTCDVRLKDGSRMNVVLPPLSLQGPVVTIRRFRPCYSSLKEIQQQGTITKEQAATLTTLVKEKKNIVIAGNTGSGKTTLLNILSGLIEDDERILTLEDTAELKLQKPHVLSFETRMKNTEGKGEVSMHDLVVNALRMRPDRLIVGECRGKEVIPMLHAMNTGHKGSMTTLHANSASDAMSRLEGLVLLGAPSWPIEVVRQQISSAVDVFIFLKREGSHRKLVEIVETAAR